MTRHAIISNGDEKQIARYLPDNYAVTRVLPDGSVLIAGEDHAGWTLDDYVIPRLASGLYWAEEITHERAVQEITEANIATVTDLPEPENDLYGYDGVSYALGDRVEIHPGTDYWMRGARYGTVVRVSLTPKDRVHVQLDKVAGAIAGTADTFRLIESDYFARESACEIEEAFRGTL